MTSLLWPDWLADVWAKSPEQDGIGGESLAQHTWLVLRNLAGMKTLRPHLPKMTDCPGLWQILFWACLLHDFGKVAKGFQDRLRGGPRWPHRHEVLSLAFLDWLHKGLSKDEKLWIGAAIVYHHKDPEEISRLYMELEDCADSGLAGLEGEVTEEVLSGLWQWLAQCVPVWIEELGLDSAGVKMVGVVTREQALHRFKNDGALVIGETLRNIRRWLRRINRPRIATLTVAVLALRGHVISCDHAASAHVEKLSKAPLSSRDTLLKQWNLPAEGLYAHQKACLQTSSSAIMIAPTGSGKTEAALLWAINQEGRDRPLARLFYALPYQASMNAMYGRLDQRSFPGMVGLEHSRSILALYKYYLAGDYSSRQAFKQARWSRQLSRLHHYPIRVLSPYQMLKAFYRLKGYEGLLTDFLSGLFVFDEIHAYDVQRLGAIVAAIRYLRENFDARFLVMSATLPGLLQAQLAAAIGTDLVIRATPAVFNRFRRHRLLLQEGDLTAGGWPERIAVEAEKGKSVLVCCNTIGRAQQVYSQLAGILGDGAQVILLHSRFNSRDRLNKERLIQEASGFQSDTRRPIVLVATQVVEVSLDIDLDVIYTDPAPLEALIQRFGRINRRCLKKWAPVYVFTEPSDGQYVYEAELVQKSLAVLKKHAGRIINEEEISVWLDEVYQGRIAETWDREFQAAYTEFAGVCLKTMRAFDAKESLEELFYQAFDGMEVLPAGLQTEYETFLLANEPLEASQLLVPLSWRRFSMFRRKGLARKNGRGQPSIVDVSYNSEVGLMDAIF